MKAQIGIFKDMVQLFTKGEKIRKKTLNVGDWAICGGEGLGWEPVVWECLGCWA